MPGKMWTYLHHVSQNQSNNHDFLQEKELIRQYENRWDWLSTTA